MPRAKASTNGKSKAQAGAGESPSTVLDLVPERELLSPKLLTPHPRNYATHSEAEIAHIVASIKADGFYRNVGICRGNVILFGHASILAALFLGLHEVPVVRFDYEPNDPRALRLLTGDNEISRGRGLDDRQLLELLTEINNSALTTLEGTGFSEGQFEALCEQLTGEIVTDPDAEWDGMPEFEQEKKEHFRTLIVHFQSAEAVEEFSGLIDQPISEAAKYIYHPKQVKEDKTGFRINDES